MGIGIRILSAAFLCLFAARAEQVQCKAGETVERTGVELRVERGAKAALWVDGPCRVVLRKLKVQGARSEDAQRQGLPPSERRFAEHYGGNGVLITGAAGVLVEDSTFTEIAGFAILVSRSRDVRIVRCRVTDSGSLNAKGRNNTTGGVLIEDGSANFTVEDSAFERVLGNAVWTHSRYRHERNGPGVIRNNRIDGVARDGIQVGHAANVQVTGNTIRNVGYPVEAVDMETLAMPVGIDTAGNVDSSTYSRNEITEVNGKCFDLDGFHHGAVLDNTCVNAKGWEAYPYGNYGVVMNNTNPDMQSVGIRIEGNRIEGMRYGGIFVIGSGHVVRRNEMRRLHTVHCSGGPPLAACTYEGADPDLLRAGIYMGRRAERPAVTRANVVTDNLVSGWRMDRMCIGYAPGVSARENQVSGNRCVHEGEGNGNSGR